MSNYKIKNDSANKQHIETTLKSDELLNNPHLNKGTAFTKEERKKFKLLGKLPSRVETLNEQVIRSYAQLKSYTDLNQKNIFLNELYNTNQVLFYKLASNNIEEITPLLYTPQVAVSCQTFSNEFRRPHGLYIPYSNKEHIAEIIDNRPYKDVELIVVTDGERILGIGDQGVGGIGIPIGKLMLYSLFGRINPAKTLPIILDVGTNNKNLLNDPIYLGWRHKRISGKKYTDFIDDFVSVLKQKLPNVLLQWEDFGKANAPVLLERYRKKICSFNDDIQGTAVVTLAAILAAIKTSKQKLKDQRIVILGAGSASVGIANLITTGMKREGLNASKAHKQFWLLGRNGLITQASKDTSNTQKPYLRKEKENENWDVKNKKAISLLEVVKNVKPTILIGCSTAANTFTKEIVKEMAKHIKQPIILPLSNPTANSEASPSDLIKWTDGRALIATGSPFKPVIHKNKKYVIAQCNNALAFPGIGLGVIASRAKKVSDEMLWSAVEALYKEAPCLKNRNKPLLPSIKDASYVANKIGKKVAKTALKNGLSPLPTDTNITTLVNKTIWKIDYRKLIST
jgi:malate dehydrogenase (oxaloacetate-decarboxylating)